MKLQDLRIAVYSAHIESGPLSAETVHGYQSITLEVTSNLEELKKLLASGITYVILDPRMPGVGQAELSSSLRHLPVDSQESKSPNRVLFVLSDASLATTQDFTSLSETKQPLFDEFLRYPLDHFELIMRLQAYERRALLRREIREIGSKLQSTSARTAHEIRQVQELQYRGLPQRKLDAPLDYAWFFEPSDYLSGDNLNVVALDDRWVGFYLLDVCGHGVPSAVDALQMSRELQLNFRRAAWYLDMSPTGDGWDDWTLYPSQVVSKLNQRYASYQQDESIRYATLVFGYLDTATGRGMLCRAGHPAPVVVRKDGHIEYMEEGDPPVGLLEEAEYSDVAFQLEAGDRMVLYSDGCLEVPNSKQEMFGLRRFSDVLKSHNERSAGELLESLNSALETFRDPTQDHVDDYSVLTLELPPSGENSDPWVSTLRDMQPIPTVEVVPVEESAFRKVLMVEDSRSMITVTKAFLMKHGYEVKAVPRAELAMQVIQSWQPDLLLTDWDLPGMSGYELAQKVQAEMAQPPYILIMSGQFDRSQLLMSLGMAADDFLAKPLRFEELLFRLTAGRQVLNKRKQLCDYNQRLSELSARLGKDLERVTQIKLQSLAGGCNSPERVCCRSLMGEDFIRSASQVSFWPLDSRMKAFFVLKVPHRSLLGMFLSFLVELDFHHDSCPFIEYNTEGNPELVAPHWVRDFMFNWLKRQQSECLEFELIYGLVDMHTGVVSVDEASSGEAHLLQGSNLSTIRGGDGIASVSLRDRTDGSLLLGFDLGQSKSQCALNIVWQGSESVFPGMINRGARQQINKALEAVNFLLPNQTVPFGKGYEVPVHALLDEIVELSEAFEHFGLTVGLDERQCAALRLTLVELGTNVLRHGVAFRDEALMSVYFIPMVEGTLVAFTDTGREVPAEAFLASQSLVSMLDDMPVEDLPTGGFGLSIISNSSDKYKYVRMEGVNYHFMYWLNSHCHA